MEVQITPIDIFGDKAKSISCRKAIFHGQQKWMVGPLKNSLFCLDVVNLNFEDLNLDPAERQPDQDGAQRRAQPREAGAEKG